MLAAKWHEVLPEKLDLALEFGKERIQMQEFRS